MEIKKSNSTKIIIAISAAVVLVACAGYLSYAYLGHIWPFQSQSKSNSDNTANTPSNDSAPEINHNTAEPPKKSDNPQDKTPTQYDTGSSTSNDTAQSSSITGAINFAQVSGGKLTIRVTIDQHLSPGTCTLTLSSSTSSKIVTQSANTTDNPSSSSCQGFDVATSELSPGQWNINIKVISGDQEGQIKSQVNI